MNDTPQQTASTSDPEFAAVADPDRLLTALESVAAVVDECRMSVGPDGVAVAAVDAASVAMVNLTLSSSAFEDFSAAEGTFGVDVTRLVDVVGMADGDRPVELTLDSRRGQLDVRVGEVAYSLGLIDPEAIRRPPSSEGYAGDSPVEIGLRGERLDRALRAAGMVADHVTLGVDPEPGEFYVAATGDTDDVRFELPAEECERFSAADVEATFSLEYLSAVSGALPSDGTVDLSLDTDRPVEPGFTFADGDGNVDYALAPRRVVGN